MKYGQFLLPAVLGIGLSLIFILPRAGDTAQSAISMTLPQRVLTWELSKVDESEKEKKTLAQDTEFSKALCTIPRSFHFDPAGQPLHDRIDLSIVLSGHDLANSIHRPERCMPAQGHTIISSAPHSIALPNGRTLAVRRLRSVQTLINEKDRSLDQDLESITYYFFVGRDRIETDHLKRTLVDMRDRLVEGIDQRWAYVTVTTWTGKVPGCNKLGHPLWGDDFAAAVSESEANERLDSFLRSFATEQIDWNRIRN